MQARSSAVFRPEFVRLLALQPLGGFTICVFYLLPKFLTAELHATASEVGLVSAAFGAASLLSVPFVSFFVARGSARGLIAAATLVLTLTAFAFLWAFIAWDRWSSCCAQRKGSPGRSCSPRE